MEFAAAAKWTYENTERGDRGREILVEISVRHLKHLLEREAFSSAVAEVAELGRDILVANQGTMNRARHLSKDTFSCSECNTSWSMGWNGDDLPCCPRCESENDTALTHVVKFQWKCDNCESVIESSDNPADLCDENYWICQSCGKRGFHGVP